MRSLRRLIHGGYRYARRQLILSWWNTSLSVGILLLILLSGVLLWQHRRSFQRSRRVDERSSSLVKLRPEPSLTQAEMRDIVTRFSLQPYNGNLGARGPPPVVKKIHFMYKSHSVDVHFKSQLSSWRTVYPEYRMYFWTDAEIDLLISRRYPAWQDMYNRQLSNYMERSDTARAFVLDAMGGWYADLDTGCLSRADRHASWHALILPLEPYLHALNNFCMRRLVSNAIMYSVPQHPFWMFYLHRLGQSLVGKALRNSTLLAAIVTGPVLLTDSTLMFQQAQQGLGCPGPWCPHLAPPVQFLPVYDNSSVEMRPRFRFLCTRARLERLFDSVEFDDECRRFRQHDFDNYPLDPAESHTYHRFLHLNQRRSDANLKSDVRTWHLRLVHGRDLVAEINKL